RSGVHGHADAGHGRPQRRPRHSPAGRRDPDRGPDRQRLRRGPPDLPRGRHGRSPGQAAGAASAARRPDTLDEPRSPGKGRRGIAAPGRRRQGTPMTDSSTATAPRKPGMGDVFRALGRARVLITLLLGFGSGLPFLLTGATLSIWLAEGDVTLSAI